MAGFRIELIEPGTLESLAVFKLPGRPSTFQALVNMDKSIVMTDSSGGAYYYLDDQDRVVLADRPSAAGGEDQPSAVTRW